MRSWQRHSIQQSFHPFIDSLPFIKSCSKRTTHRPGIRASDSGTQFVIYPPIHPLTPIHKIHPPTHRPGIRARHWARRWRRSRSRRSVILPPIHPLTFIHKNPSYNSLSWNTRSWQWHSISNPFHLFIHSLPFIKIHPTTHHPGIRARHWARRWRRSRSRRTAWDRWPACAHARPLSPVVCSRISRLRGQK